MPMPVPTPPSTTSSNGASPDHGQFRVVRKRNRVPLSCAPCRNRKLKCNRAHPCDNCTKRGDISSCTYAASTTRRKPGAGVGPNGTPDDMQNRIDRLENLVLSLMSTGQTGAAAAAQSAIDSARNRSLAGASASATTSMDHDRESEMQEDGHEDDSDVNDLSQGVGVMKVDGGKSMFISDAHWYALLANIAEVKSFYANHMEDVHAQYRRVAASQDEDEDAKGAAFLFKAPRLNSKEEVMASFPAKPQTDVLIGRYFNSYDPSVHIIHGPTFQKQYDRHWQDPTETSLPFIAMMYAMMSLALQSYDRASDEPPEYLNRSWKLSIAYRRLTAQTLVLAGVSETIPQILEALVLHFQAEFAPTRDTESGLQLLISMTVRLAMRMGYHRDPGPHPNISPFQAEMRRRVWCMIRQGDLLFSFQAGLPPTSRSDACDTQIPRNLYDDELSEDMAVLPPPRPDTEATPMSYMISKARISQVFGKITERLSSVTEPPSYEEVMEIDTTLRDARANTPPHLRLRPLRESMNEHANLIMQRYGLELIYLKSQCVLHRRFLSRGRENPRFAYSRRTCIDASMDMLTHQATLHHESQPGGRLHAVKWYISSLTANDFLLAAMIVCLELHHVSEAERLGTSSRKGSMTASPMSQDLIDERRDEMLAALRHSMSIWDSFRDRSIEAWKASTTLRVMLEKVISQRQAKARADTATSRPDTRVPMPASIFQPGVPLMGSTGSAPMGGIDASGSREQEQAAALTLGLLAGGGVSPNQFGGTQLPGATDAAAAGRGYPAGMAGLLNNNEQMADQAPNAFLPQSAQDSAANGTGPYGNFLSMGGQSMFDNIAMGEGADIDWGAWDSFVQGATMDPVSMWPSMMPGASFDSGNGAIDPAIAADTGGGGGMDVKGGSGGGGNAFMGAGTPSAAGY